MIELPDGVVPNMVQPALIDFGSVQRPPLGGPLQRVNRLGNRFRVSVSLPPILNRDLGRVIVSRLLRAKTEGIRIEWELVGIEQGSPGSPLVKGAGQAGSSLLCDGFRAGYGFSEGFWLSIAVSGQHYLHNVAVSGSADGAGEATLTLTPPLRVSPADNSPVHLQKPMIEGLVMGDEWAWEYSLAHHVGISFDIEEAA